MDSYRTMSDYTRGNSARSAVVELLKILVAMAEVEYPEPDWDDLPPWANWWAIDNVGRICWFQVQPSHHVTGWQFGGMHGNSRIGNDLPLGCDWRLTLRQRPSPKVI